MAKEKGTDTGPRNPDARASGGAVPTGRGRLARRLAIALALVVLIAVPAYLAARPGFFSRYPGLKTRYEPWAASSHAETGCDGCHVRPRLLDRALYRVRMTGEFYVSLVSRSRVPDVFATPSDEACLTCHSDLRTVSPDGDLRIPHRAHVSVLKMHCVECHDFLVHEKSPEGKHTPPMAGCLRCHDGDKAKSACSACHTEKAAPATHRNADWLVAHGRAAVGADCVRCHRWATDWCSDCHRQRPRSHTADWRAAHGRRVSRHRSCEACHRAAFCVRCHGEVPALNFDPTLDFVP